MALKLALEFADREEPSYAVLSAVNDEIVGTHEKIAKFVVRLAGADEDLEPQKHFVRTMVKRYETYTLLESALRAYEQAFKGLAMACEERGLYNADGAKLPVIAANLNKAHDMAMLALSKIERL